MSQPTIELQMIVKNGAATLARCLGSVAPVVDRIVIGDTGSTDTTVEMARRFGAEVFAVEWEQDFARARNRVLERATCEWVLVLDADEMLDSAEHGKIRALAERDEVAAYDVWRWNYIRESHGRSGEQAAIPNPVVMEEARAYPAYALSLNTRMFRRHAGIVFEHCVHETVAGRVDALGLKRAEADFVIHHFGQAEDAEQVRQGKNELYQELGLKKLRAEPENARAYFEVGLGELEHFKRPAAALAYFERACALKPDDGKAFLFAGVCLTRLGRCAEALQRLARAHALGARGPVLHEAMGDAHFHAAQYGEARAAYEQALRAGGVSPVTRAKLGAAEVHLGLAEQGIQRMRQAVQAAPEFPELYDILIAGALLGGNVALAAQTAEARLEVGQPEDGHIRLAAELRAMEQTTKAMAS